MSCWRRGTDRRPSATLGRGGADRGRKSRLSSRPLPPPNRACGSPAHGSLVGGSPLGGLTGQRIGCREGEQPVLGKGRQHALRPYRRLGPCPTGTNLPGGISLCRHWRRLLLPRHGLAHPPSCAPWLHAHYGRFPATMGALTPVRHSLLRTGLPASRTWPSRPFRLQPPSAPRRRFCTLPLSATGVPLPWDQASPLASRLAAAPRPNRVRLLRTGRSPPAASHPASRRRSCSRLHGRRASAVEGTCTPLTPYACRRTSSGTLCPVGRGAPCAA